MGAKRSLSQVKGSLGSAVAVTAILAVISSVLQPSASAAEPAEEAAPGYGELVLDSWDGELADVPPIGSPELEPALPEVPVGIEPAGLELGGAIDASPMAGLSDEATRTEVVSERAANRRVFERSNGLREVQLYAGPRLFERAPGQWSLIDTHIVADETRAGGLRSAANSWTAQFLPVMPEGGGLVLESGDASIGLRPLEAQQSSPTTTPSEPSVAVYEDVWPEVDLRYTVQTTGVKEDIVVASPQAAPRFEFAVEGARATRDGAGLMLEARGQSFAVPAPTVLNAAGVDVTAASGAAYEVAQDGTAIAVVVDAEWLVGLPSEAFPVFVDPTVFVTLDGPSDAQARNYSSTDTTFTSGDLVRIGRNASGQVWRSRVHFDYELYLRQTLGTTYRVAGASMALFRDSSDSSTPANGRATPYVSTAASYAGVTGQRVDNGWGGLPTLNEGGLQVMRWEETTFEGWLSRLVGGWFDDDLDGMWFGFAGNETTNGTMHTYWPTLSLYLVEPPPVTSLTAPAAGSVLSTRTPTLQATAVSGDSQVHYRYEVSTARGGGAASVVTSGWTTDTSWTVPEQALHDGATYYARVYTAYDITNPDTPDVPRFTDPLDPVMVRDREFRIDLKLGSGGPAPTETAGTVPGVTDSPEEGSPSPSTPGAAVKVNLVNGNAAVSVPIHSVTAVGGQIAPALVYNSRADSTTGLLGQYFTDPNRTKSFTGAGVSMRSQRVDKKVNFNWLDGAPPVESITSGPYLTRWSGFVSVPTTGSWQIGVAVTDWSIGGDGGARLYLNNEATPAANLWSSPNPTAWEITQLSGARSMTAGAKIPIRIEFAGEVGRGGIRLVARRGTTNYTVQPSWLSQSSPTLPDGWQLTTGAGGATWVGLADYGDTVVIRAADGSSRGFRRLSTGGYRPPAGSNDHLTIDGQGRFVLNTADGMLYRFRSDGQLERVVSAFDDRTPAAHIYTYTGSLPRLTSITDPVSGRSVNFDYAPTCTGPSGMLCRIRFWDGASSTLSYDASGRLIRVANPGYVTGSGAQQPTLFDFGYDTLGRITSIRDPLAADLIAFGRRTDDDTVRTMLAYDTTNRLTSITKPEPEPGRPRSKARYAYSALSTVVRLDGFTPSIGFARVVTYDSHGRITKDVDPTGRITEYKWDNHDRLAAEVAPSQLTTSYAYNTAGQRTDTWGPAPAADFGPDFRPLPGTTVPHSTTEYDGGMRDLAVAYWPNEFLAGSPTDHATGLPDNDMAVVWATPPITPGPNGRWSMRMTGEIRFPGPDQLTLHDSSDGEIRVWIDDVLVLDTWNGRSLSTGDVAGTVQEWRRIRIEYRSPPTGQQRLLLSWPHPDFPDTGSHQWIPESALRPTYGLATRSTDADGMVTATRYTDSTAHIGPEHGLPTAVTTDPNGLALTTRHGYEDPTVGGFLRQSGRTLPAGNTWASTHYGGTEGPIAPVCGVAPGASQGGLLKQRVGPDPDGPDAAQIDQFVYDPSGRQVGTRTGTTATIATAGWSCTSFDGRGRTLTQTWPAHGTSPIRQVNHIYAAGANPLITLVDEPGSPEAQVATRFDLVGHATLYYAGRFATETTYDQLGRITASTGPVGNLTYAYDANTGRLDTVILDGNQLVDITYDSSTGRLASVTYDNATISTIGYDRHGRQDSVTTTGPAGTRILGDQATLSPAGRVIDQLVDLGTPDLVDPNPSGPNLVYDTAGRLTTWHGPTDTEIYSYATATCGSTTAGRNTNRTTVLRGSLTSRYCYDTADRLVAGASTTAVAYDDHGNTTQLNDHAYTYDAADQLVGINAGTASMVYERDAVGRIIERIGTGGTSRPRYTDFSGSVAFTVDAANQITERHFALPGGARVTLSGASEQWSYSNLHGDTVAIADASGTRTAGPVIFSPWGEGAPADTDSGPSDLGYLGGHGKYTDTTPGIEPLIDLGARGYDPEIGRFLSVDPVVGGCANDYVYVTGDPVNATDLTGMAWWNDVVDAIGNTAGNVASWINRNACGIAEAAGWAGALLSAAGLLAAVVLAPAWVSVGLGALGLGASVIRIGAGGIAGSQRHVGGGILGVLGGGMTMMIGGVARQVLVGLSTSMRRLFGSAVGSVGALRIVPIVKDRGRC